MNILRPFLELRHCAFAVIIVIIIYLLQLCIASCRKGICQDNSGAFPSEVILLYNFFAVKTDNSKSPALTAFFESATVVIHLKLGSK